MAKESKGADIKVAKKDAEIKVVAKGDVASVTVAKTADVTLTVNKTATVASVNVAAKGASVDLNAKGTVSDVKVSEKAADTKLNINASGKVENVQIDAKADVAVAGSTTEAVKVTVNAKDTTIKAETAVETTLNADAKVDLSKGAEGSKVTTAENVKVDVANNTEDKVTVTDSTGKETSVDAGKTETTKDESKKDDQKKDDQSSGGSSGGSSGTVTPTPTPSEQEGKIYQIYVEDTDLISVYLDDVDEVPASFDKKNIEIKDSNKNTVNVKKVQKDENGYFIWLESDMQNNTTYTFTMHLNGKKYVKDYMYDEDALNKLKGQMSGMSAVIENAEVPASETALSSPTLFEDALIEFFEKEYKQAMVSDDYEVNYLKESSRNESIVTSSMEINLYYEKDNINMCYGQVYDVRFVCKGEKFVVTKPTIEYKLKDSIVVKGEDYYEYACVEKDSNINVEKIEKWVSPDQMGKCQFTDLKANTKYLLYARYGGDSKLSTSIEFELDGNGKSVICLAEPNGQTNFEKENVDAGTEIKVPLFVHVAIYGNHDDDNAVPECELTSSNKELQSFLNSWSLRPWDEETHCPILSFPIPKGLKSGDYTVNVECRYVYYKEDGDSEDDSIDRAVSNPVNITVKFHCNAVENPEVKEPKVLYTFSNSIVVKAEDGFQYACAEEGTVAEEWKTDRDEDELGNIEFDSLNPNTTYIVYARLANEWGNYKTISQTTASDLKNPVVIVESDGDKTINAGEVKAGDKIHIPLKDLKKACYGSCDYDVNLSDHISFNLGDQSDLLADLEASIEEEHPDDDEWYYCLEILVPESLTTGTYTISFVYTYKCFIDESETPVSETKPITYKVTFTVAK